MATVRVEAVIDVSAARVWDAVADVVEGQRMPLTYHHASFQVFGEGDGCRLVWVTDVLPHAMAPMVRGVVERGITEIKETLESGS
ncbi:hypothetical protein AB0J83_23520 [Actinoplanes sp. NPDC049596]|uniref:hypothetical protein n=1 Tax=unclassified Actinoplanes TaxID=2626549 RepID=UPI003433C017